MQPVEFLILLGKVIVYLSDTLEKHNSLINSDPIKSSYDYIIVGAGSAGAVVANRLSEDGNNSVLLIEAGGPQNMLSDIPMMWLTNLQTEHDWGFETQPLSCGAWNNINNASYWARGKLMGGSSSLNAMLYVRGNRDDYNNWEKLGAKGWNWDNMAPYFIRAETNHDESVLQCGLHGRKGPLHVITPPSVGPLSEVSIVNLYFWYIMMSVYKTSFS